MSTDLGVGLKIILQRYHDQGETRRALGTKASAVLAYVGVLARILFNVLSNKRVAAPASR
ncbi:MAG TPA: hypothetical protein VM537_09385 [Anaerolineae bacterium]|nr:hypothetical protein [Anaerolineae bacterium]